MLFIDHDLLAIVPGPGLLFGLMLLAALFGGHAARWLHIPRVIGFLAGGVALRLILRLALTGDNTTGSDMTVELENAAMPLEAIKDLALGLILFTIGSVFQQSHLKAVGSRALKISLWEIGLVIVFVGLTCGLIVVLSYSGPALTEALVLAALLAMAGIATAPAATLFVLSEYDAKGPITDTILAATGINNIVCIVLFYLTFFFFVSVGAVSTTGALTSSIWLALGSIVFGSLLIGCVCGVLLSVAYAKLPLAETTLIFFTMFIVLGAGESWMLRHVGYCYNFLLTSLIIGGLFANIAVDSGKLADSIRTIGSPIFAGFFVMAGYELHLEELKHIGLLGGAYIIARTAAKVIGARQGARWARAPQRADWMLGGALLCQAAVVIGLASFIRNNWDSPFAGQFGTIILGSVVVFELIGPLLIKRCVVQGGEVKAITLIGRGRPTTEGGRAARLTWHSFLRLLGHGQKRKRSSPKELHAQDVMRTNVHFIKADSTLDEVLHFIERSTYSHFPVVDDQGIYVGVIHFSDVRDVIYDPTMHDLVTAEDFSDPESTVVSLDLSLPELLKLFTRDNVGVLPVVDGLEKPRIVGLVEQRDVLRAMTPGKP